MEVHCGFQALTFLGGGVSDHHWKNDFKGFCAVVENNQSFCSCVAPMVKRSSRVT